MVFDRIVLISLDRRTDRREQFAETYPSCFPRPDLFHAIDGRKLPLPIGWKESSGTWGCLQSHRQVLERAIMDGVESLLIFEDDATFHPNFVALYERFLEYLPADWDGFMLGGQHLTDATRINRWVVRCLNTHRTHAYALRGKWMLDLYKEWISGNRGHCDHVMGSLEANYRIYAPESWIVGQSEGKSDINGIESNRRYWQPVSSVMVLLRCPLEVIRELTEEYGFFVPADLDSALNHDRPTIRLRDCIAKARQDVQRMSESVNGSARTVCFYHDKATLEALKQATNATIIEIQADTIDEVFARLGN